MRASAAEAERSAALLERAAELAKQHAAHLLELRALTSLARAQGQRPTETLMQRLAAVLRQLTLQPDSANARDARLLVPGSERNPAAIG